MPEGPEVRYMVAELNQYFKNSTLKKVKINSGRYSKKPPENFDKFNKSLPTKINQFGLRKVYLGKIKE